LFIDRKAKLESYQGERGPIEEYLTSSEEEEEEEEDEEEFIVDDDIIDGEKKTDKDSEMATVEMPGKNNNCIQYNQLTG
jgi:hypothetical protein